MTDAPDAPQFELVLKFGPDSGLTETAIKNRAILAKAYDDMVAGDDQALVKILDPEVVFIEADGLPYGTTEKGVEGAMRGVAGMFGAWRHLRAEFYEYLTGGDLVIAYMMLTGTSRATGRVYKGPTAELFRFRNGKIIEWRPIYWDTHAVRQACGLEAG